MILFSEKQLKSEGGKWVLTDIADDTQLVLKSGHHAIHWSDHRRRDDDCYGAHGH